MSQIIEIENICKAYDKISAVDNVSLSCKEGEIFAIIGEDGAGKTTLIRMMTTLIIPDSGRGVVKGFDIVKDFSKIREIIGYMPGTFSLYMDLSVRENVNFFATIYGTSLEENYDLIKDIYSQIEPFEKRKAKALSGGMKQKLALCCTLVHKPDILFLDEPTTGVDPVSRKEFWGILKRLKENGMTIIVSTPYMDEAVLADKVALMHASKFLKVDTPEGIINDFKKRIYGVRGSRVAALLKDIRKIVGVESCYAFGESCHMIIDDKIEITEVSTYLKNLGHDDVKIEKISANIEDCFMEFIR